jgi:hypothetical protein
MFPSNASLLLPFDPITLSYVTALRGVTPRLPPDGFTYAEMGCGTAERLILLAACNPEGVFFGFDPDLEKLSRAAQRAEQLQVRNVTFSQAGAVALKQAVDEGVIGAKCLGHLVYNEIGNPAREDIEALHDCALVLLQDNGVFAYRYQTYDEAQADALLFKQLTRQMLDASATEAFAKEWRQLAQLYLSSAPQLAEAFDKALAQGKGVEWLRTISATDAKPSKTSRVGQVFAGKDLTLLGSANLPANYLELSTPEVAHAPLNARRQHPLYEALKDLAMNTSERVDLWGREPLQRSDNLISLFGGFNFGTLQTAERIARTVIFQGKSISFASPLYDGILSLATVMPVTMGDLVHHESLAGTDNLTLLNSVQLLVACGLLQPMRSSYDGGVDMDNAKLVGSYNRSLRGAKLDLQDYAFASVVTGRPVVFSGMNALVLQALDKGGLEKIGVNLATELMRLSSHPYLRPLSLNEPQRALDESVRQIETAFHQSMVRWFSLGILQNEDAEAMRAAV